MSEVANTFILRKQRSLNEILNASFSFVRQHRQILMKGLVRYVLPLLILCCGLLVIVFQSYMPSGPGGRIEEPEAGTILFTVMVVFLVCLIMLVVFAITNALYFAVVKLSSSGQPFELPQVKKLIKKSVGPLIGLYILQSIITMVVNYAVMIPSFFISAIAGAATGSAVVSVLFMLVAYSVQIGMAGFLSLSSPVLVFENRSVFSCLQRSASLVRDHFWPTFGLMILVYIIAYEMMMAPIVHPVLILSILKQVVDPVATMQWLYDSRLVISIAASIYGLFVAMCGFFLWMYPTIALSLQYMSLVERKEGIGLAMRVNNTLEPVPPGYFDKPVETAEETTAAVDAQVQDADVSEAKVAEENSETSDISSDQNNAQSDQGSELSSQSESGEAPSQQ